MNARPDTPIQRTRAPRSARTRSPRTRRRSGAGSSGKWLGGLVLGTIVAVGCTSTSPAVARQTSSFGSSLSLALSLGHPLVVGDKSMAVEFALTNDGSEVFDGCFGQAWGVSVIVGGQDAGRFVRADYPKCDERVRLLPRQTIVWSKNVSLHDLRSGPAKLTGWVRVVDPAACDPRRGCRDVSVASRVQTITIGER